MLTPSGVVPALPPPPTLTPSVVGIRTGLIVISFSSSILPPPPLPVLLVPFDFVARGRGGREVEEDEEVAVGLATVADAHVVSFSETTGIEDLRAMLEIGYIESGF